MHEDSLQAPSTPADVNRRAFLGTGAAAGALAAVHSLGNPAAAVAQTPGGAGKETLVPKRTLGRTGVGRCDVGLRSLQIGISSLSLDFE